MKKKDGQRRQSYVHVPIPAAMARFDRLKRAFHLRSLPRKVPFDTGIGLKLPYSLSRDTIHTIVVMAFGKMLEKQGAPWYQGDIVNWIKVHPASGVTLEGVYEVLRSERFYTNPKERLRKVASNAAHWPVGLRVEGASFNHHDASRTLPYDVARDLLRQAAVEGKSCKWIEEQRDNYRDKHGLASPKETAARELHKQSHVVYLLTGRRRGMRDDLISQQLRVLRVRIDDWKRLHDNRS